MAQVVGSLAKINIAWPAGLKDTLQWFSGLNLEITQLPSLACMLAETPFSRQLLGCVHRLATQRIPVP